MDTRLPNGWKQRKLTDIATVSFSTVDKKSKADQHPVLLCNYMDVWKNARIHHGLDFMPSTASTAEFERFRLQRDDVLITKDSETREEIAQPAIVEEIPENLVLGYHLALIRPKPDQAYGPFLAAQLAVPQFRSQFVRAAAGATRYGLKLESVESATVLLPSLAEQRRIAKILNAVDDAIAATRTVIAQTRRLKSALLCDLLTHGLPGKHSRVTRCQGISFPSKWRMIRLGDVVIDDGLQTGPFGGQLHASDYSNDGIPVVMPVNMGAGRISEQGIARVSPDHVLRLSKHKLMAGDIVFGRRGDIGRCALVTDQERGWICGTGCLRARPGKDVNPSYLIHYLSQQAVLQWLHDNAVGQTMLNLSTKILTALPIALPGFQEQKTIASLLDAIDRQIQIQEKQSAEIMALKFALSQALLTGHTNTKKGEPQHAR